MADMTIPIKIGTNKIDQGYRHGSAAPRQAAFFLDCVGWLPVLVVVGLVVQAVIHNAAVWGIPPGPISGYPQAQVQIVAVLFVSLAIWVGLWHSAATFFRYLAARYEQAERHG
jgi:hypothetical protein